MLGAGTLTTRNLTSFSSINNTATAPNQRSFIAALRLRRGIGGFNKSPLKHNQDFDQERKEREITFLTFICARLQVGLRISLAFF